MIWKGQGQTRVRIRHEILGMRDVWFRFEGEESVEVIEIEAIFQHNMFARPYLVAGRNLVNVRVSDPAALNLVPLEVTWRWEEQGMPRVQRRKLVGEPFRYSIDVGGNKLPRMKSLELSSRGRDG